jgi:hypothetical protein
MRIRIRINADPDPDQKLQFNYPEVSIKNIQTTGESFIPQKIHPALRIRIHNTEILDPVLPFPTKKAEECCQLKKSKKNTLAYLSQFSGIIKGTLFVRI